MRRADPHRVLLRALHSRHPELRVLRSRTEPWSSATFTGTRHILTCAPLPLDGLADAEFELAGHVLVDIIVEPAAEELVIEALMLEAD